MVYDYLSKQKYFCSGLTVQIGYNGPIMSSCWCSVPIRTLLHLLNILSYANIQHNCNCIHTTNFQIFLVNFALKFVRISAKRKRMNMPLQQNAICKCVLIFVLFYYFRHEESVTRRPTLPVGDPFTASGAIRRLRIAMRGRVDPTRPGFWWKLLLFSIVLKCIVFVIFQRFVEIGVIFSSLTLLYIIYNEY